MRALLDVNVLIALLDAEHSLHAPALDWFTQHARLGWASCPITQNGCVRIMSHPGYTNAQPVHAVAVRLAEATCEPEHEFWPDSVSLLNQQQVNTTHIHGPRQLTDIYLLALAVQHGGRLVTFDKSIAINAVLGAHKKNLLVL